jgi:hypothetical protein
VLITLLAPTISNRIYDIRISSPLGDLPPFTSQQKGDRESKEEIAGEIFALEFIGIVMQHLLAERGGNSF